MKLILARIQCVLLLAALSSTAMGLNKKSSPVAFVDKAVAGIKAIPNSSKTTFQLISHGRPGQLLLDGQWRNAEQVASFIVDKKLITPSINHINIYGCEFAKGQIGLDAVHYLEQQLHVTVSASTNITGKDGDWKLEVGDAENVLSLPAYSGNLQCGGIVGGTGPNDDYDGDGVCNAIDLDDDNDGILDVNEMATCTDGALGAGNAAPLAWDDGGGTSVRNQVNSTQYLSNVIVNPTTDAVIGSGMAVSITSGFWHLTNIDATNFSQSVTNNEYIQFPLLTKSVSGNILELKGWTTNQGAAINANVPENFTIQVADNASFNNPYTLSTVTGYTSSGTGLIAFNFQNKFLLGIKGTTYFVRIYYYNVSGGIGDQDGFGLYFNCYSPLDTDGDGIPNNLDLDSDGDGCPDAIEGGANFTTTTPSSIPGGNSGTGYNGTSTTPITGNLGNTVDANGVPTVAGASGQTVAYSQNKLINECTDTDGDGVPDLYDLDDDNDGILDLAEMATCSDGALGANAPLGWDDGGGTFIRNLGNTTQYLTNVTSTTATDAVIGSGMSVTITGGFWHLTNVDATTLSQAVTNNEYIQFPLQTKSVSSSFLELKGFRTNHGAAVNGNVPENFAIQVADNPNFSNPFTLSTITGYTSTGNGLVATDFQNKYALAEKGTTYYVRIYYYNVSGGNADQDGFELYFNCYSTLDTDGDGIPNDLDLDSDGDGCPDAVEAGVAKTSGGPTMQNGVLQNGNHTGTVTTTTTATNAVVAGPYGANGFANSVETSTESGIYNSSYTYNLAINGTSSGCNSVVLAAYWLSVDATLKNDDGTVTWKVTEKNVKQYIVQRSVDGIHFSDIATVASYNSSTEKQYSYTDSKVTVLNTRKVFYRIVSVDYDLSRSYSSIVSINLPRTGTAIAVYPNPNNGVLNFTSLTGVKSIDIFNMQGALVKRFAVANSGVLSYVVAGLPTGLYAIRLMTDAEPIYLKVDLIK